MGLSSEELGYNKDNASFRVYYDCVKDSFTSKTWTRIKKKQELVSGFYNNKLTVLECFRAMRDLAKKK